MKKTENLASLPSKESLSHSLCHFLNTHFQTSEDLDGARQLQSQLRSEYESLDQQSHQLQKRIAEISLTAGRRFGVALKAAEDLKNGIEQRRIATSGAPVQCWGCEGDGDSRQSQLFKELEALASEVSRMEHARAYAENALRLERLVGDLEDAVTVVASAPAPVMPWRRAAATPLPVRYSESVASAVKILQSIESVLSQISKNRPNWKRLISVVDTRVDAAVASMRPAAIASHRSIINAVGWPPSLFSTTVNTDKESKRLNPLLEMEGEMQAKYSQSFIALSILQAVQLKRKNRQISSLDDTGFRLKMNSSKQSLHEPLWTVEELVSPIAAKAVIHFAKWNQKPELVFGLAYRIAEEYADAMDALLQPMLDEANVVGYSAREEWVCAIASMVSDHLRTRALPALVKYFDNPDLVEEGTILWLHTVDQTLAFDRKMHALASKGLGLPQVELDGVPAVGLVLSLQFSCMAAFADRPDWLEIWGTLELKDAKKKVQFELEQERAWSLGDLHHLSSGLDANFMDEKPKYAASQGKYMLSSTESFKAPAGARSIMSIVSTVFDRCRTLPDVNQRLSFIGLSGIPIIQSYYEVLVEHCRESEALTALTEQDAIQKVAICINAAFYCECTLQEWGEDIFFLELKLAGIRVNSEETSNTSSDKTSGTAGQTDLQHVKGSIFDNELDKYRRFKHDWLGKLVSVVSRGFESCCQDYMRNKKRWLERGADDPYIEDEPKTESSDSCDSLIIGKRSSFLSIEISPNFVDALVTLQNNLIALGKALDERLFSDFWRQLAASIDQLLLFGLVLGGVKFSNYGAKQFATDINALFKVFKAFCTRPAGFFPNMNDTITLLTLPASKALEILKVFPSANVSTSEAAFAVMKQHGVRKLSVALALKVLNTRILPQI